MSNIRPSSSPPALSSIKGSTAQAKGGRSEGPGRVATKDTFRASPPRQAPAPTALHRVAVTAQMVTGFAVTGAVTAGAIGVVGSLLLGTTAGSGALLGAAIGAVAFGSVGFGLALKHLRLGTL